MNLTTRELDVVEATCNRAAETLMEIGCSSVRIICTAQNSPEQTVRITAGRGNWFAQTGSVDTWLSENRNVELATAINSRPPPPDGAEM